ncbi:MAG TPA: hypothetical protein VNW52_09620 [Burkholderiaceae bacterium]|nr:hypothetical protein [Burkholderiaceae bacterium]
MSISSTEPANQICYIVPPPKPLGAAVADFIKEQIKTHQGDTSGHGAVAGVAATAAPVASINGIGQITGQVINTSA